jgi:manganese/iron transport system permease protein
MTGWLDSYLHRAIVEVVLIGAFAGVVGAHVVLRRLAFFTMAMTHATFPGVVLAAVLGFNIYLGGAAAGVLVAVAVIVASRRRGQDTTTATGVVLAAGFALGVALMSARDGFTRDLTAYLVGSVLTVNRADLVVSAAVGVCVVTALALLHKELVFAAFDPGGVRAAGYPAAVLDLGVLLAVEAVVVTSVPAVGTILSVALIVAPAATARLWTDRLGATFAIATGVGIGAGLGGLAISEHYRVAAGGAISLLAAAVFLLSWLLSPRHGLLLRRPALAS